MASRTRYSIGVDMGGTNLRAAAIDGEGNLLGKVSGSTNLGEGREAVLNDLVSGIRALRERFGTGELAGVGVAVPGFIDIQQGFIVGCNNLPQFDGFPVRDEISRRLGAPVILENDANAAALGEKWLGAGRGVNDLALLTLGTGIGGGIIVRGRVLHGFVGMAGEFGHMTVFPGGNPCGCGNNGCLEKHASATAVGAMARLLQLGDNLTSKDVLEIAQGEGEPARRASAVFETMGTALGIAIANLVNIFNFPLYLLSGGPLPAWDYFAPAMYREVEKRSFTWRNTKTRIEKAALGGEAGLFGAAYLPFLELES
ncbi:MAG: ROK family protein [Candidatus Solibacter usitatus]|nr:ROK family protein [Candidatus Solibacter usitatus]